MELGLPERPEATKEGERGHRHDRASYAPPDHAPGGVLPGERLWIRAAALGVDLVVLAGAPLLAATVLVSTALLAIPDPPATLAGLYRAAQGVFVALFLLRDRVASPGKRLFRLRAVSRNARPVTSWESVARNLPLLVPGWNLLEGLSVMRRQDRRRPGDRLAGTWVVEES